MPDNFELASVSQPTDSTATSAQALVSDAYKPSDTNTKALTADSKNDLSTANSLFGSLHFFDSSSDAKPAATTPGDGSAPAATASGDGTALVAAAPGDASAAAKPPSDSSTSASFLDKLSSMVGAGGASETITQVTGKDANGNTEVLGVGPITVSTADPFDWRHPIDSAKTFIEHPIDSTEQHLQHQGEALKDLYERVTGSDKPAEVKDPFDSPEKQHVTALESKITDPAKRAQFEKDMTDFEKRAGDCHMDPKQVSDTYHQIGRLMEAQNSPVNLNEADRQAVAEQIMNHAAHPGRIDQGNHDTCAAAALESQVFAKDPSAAAKMIVDVAVDGSFKDHDGTGVPRDPASVTTKDAHNMDYPPADNQRTMASQIFQTTAISMVYPDYRQGPPEQKGPQDTGERIGNGDDFPGLNNDQVREMSRRITGQDNGDSFIANAKDKDNLAPGEVFVDSPTALGAELAKMKEGGKLPAIINVDSRNEPFFGDSKGNVAGGSGGPHDVTVTDYIPGNPPKVVVENQWGKQSEHTMTIDQLYHATLPPGDHQTIEALKTQVGKDINDPNVDPRLKLELLRQERVATDPADKITDDQYQQQVAQVMVGAEKRWKQQAGVGKLDEEERKETWYKFDELALRADGGAAAIGKNMGADLKQENDVDLAKQLISDQQKYSTDFIASMKAQKGQATDG